MRLPEDPGLPIAPLAAAFRHTTNSYKFFWLLALLEHVREDGGSVVPLRALVVRMVAAAWHPVHYYRLSLGRQDQLARLTHALRDGIGLPVHARRNDVSRAALDLMREGGETGSDLASLLRFVPYRFLRPWFESDLRGIPDQRVNAAIEPLAAERFASDRPPLYRFASGEEAIELHPAWLTYFRRHLRILEGFTLWGLVGYLQRNNPNVPGLPDKLLPPESRALGPARKFWIGVLDAGHDVRCIYTGDPIPRSGFSIDHFVPWRFVAHDLLWNLAPVAPRANSAKSDALPDLTRYAEPFAAVQHLAFQTAYGRGRRKALEDYALLFNDDLPGVAALPYEAFRERLIEGIAPLVQIAANMGFRQRWRYAP